jgi:hypothetical protein
MRPFITGSRMTRVRCAREASIGARGAYAIPKSMACRAHGPNTLHGTKPRAHGGALSDKVNHKNRLWALINLVYWHRAFPNVSF